MNMISKIPSFLFAAMASFLAVSALSAAEAKDVQIQVNYDHPENFSDFKDSSFTTEKSRTYLMGEFTKHIRETAKHVLASGDRLEVTFTDINLAGEYEPQRGPRFDEVRIMKSVYAPHMDLTFKLQAADGKVIAEGKRNLTDLNYLMTIPNGFNSDSLRYDKQLLTDWIRSEFSKRH
jgi:hypothetical protein